MYYYIISAYMTYKTVEKTIEIINIVRGSYLAKRYL